MLSITFKISYRTKMKRWNIWEHVAFQRMWFSMLLRLSTGVRITWTRCLAKVWGGWHRHSWFCRQSSAFVILWHQEFIICMITTLLKQRSRQNQDFWRLANKALDHSERILFTGMMPTKSPTKVDQSIPKAGNRHSQRFSSQFKVILIAY